MNKINTLSIENLQSTFELGRETYHKSELETKLVWSYFHNNYYTADQCAMLDAAGLPKETFNIVKLFSRQLTGLYSTMYNTVKVNPRHPSTVQQCALLNDTIRFIDDENHTEAANERLRLDCIISGLMAHEVTVTPSIDENGNVVTDMYGRVQNDIHKAAIPSHEIVLDPMSTAIDYSDARFVHRYRWITGETAIDMFGKGKVSKLDAYNTQVATYFSQDKVDATTSYRRHDNYLVVHTYIRYKGDVYSIWWSENKILAKTKIEGTYNKFPYQIVKLQESNEPEYYGVFHDVLGSILAIHQGLIQIQMHINSNKVVVRKGAVDDEDWDEFKVAVVRVNSILELDNPEDIKILNLDRDIAQQYMVVDRAFDRIQRVLGINDSFLGHAYASDSGRKVKLQQNQTLMALRYLDIRFKLMFNLIGRDSINLIKQYYTSYRIMRITNLEGEDNWIEINKPLVNPATEEVMYYEEKDISTGMPLRDKQGNKIVSIFNDNDTDISIASSDFEIVSTMYNDDDEKNQLMLETMLSGTIGIALQQYNPAGYLRASALSVKSMKSKHSNDIASILLETASSITPQQPDTPHMQPNQQGGAQGSAALKLPQNTNEGV